MTLPERVWNPGDSPVLPPVPEHCYPAGAVPLDLDPETPTSVADADRAYEQDVDERVRDLDERGRE